MFLLFFLTGSESGRVYRALVALNITADVFTSVVLLCDPSRTAALLSHICVAVLTKNSQNKVRKITAGDVAAERGEPLYTAIGNVTGTVFWRTLWTTKRFSNVITGLLARKIKAVS